MAEESNNEVRVTLMSFGFKYGMPNANYWFDVGFLKNPARKGKWGFFSKPVEEMERYVLEQEEAQEFLNRVEPLLRFLATIDQNQIFAFGCSAGRHRSSLLVEELSRRLERAGIKTNVRHRDNDM